jgi:hypothetical protein
MEANEHADAGQALLAWDAEQTMSWPILPVAMRLKTPGWPVLWLPVILLWPLFILIFCLALPLCALVPAPRRHAVAALIATYQMMCALHGTHVELTGAEHGTWSISLY